MHEVARRTPPVWAMGMSNCTLGFVFGFISTAMGILLSERGVSLGRIAGISAIAFSPSFWAWLISPALDVHFRKKTYAFALAAIAAAMLLLAVLSVAELTLFTAALTASCTAAVLYGYTVTSVMVDTVGEHQFDAISGWLNVANLGAAGVVALVVIGLVRSLSLPVAAVLLALLVFAPCLLLLPVPPVPAPQGSLHENFRVMAVALRRILREGRVWIGLLIFLSPICFSLTNLFSSMGSDYHASERLVTSVNGPGVAVACALGCLLAIPVTRVIPRRTLYLLTGFGSAAAAVTLAFLPSRPESYVLCVLAYNFCQGFNYTAFTALAMEITGQQNALSATMLAMLTASANVPISGMTWVDGAVHDRYGLRPMLLTDAGCAALAAVVLLVLLPVLDRKLRQRRGLALAAS
jgi:PAT family beta-lactamase induction signal transducer AmpG